MSIDEIELEFITKFIPIDNEDDFSCPVCYTDGAKSGLVQPSNCSHKICLECYTNIATKTTALLCPMCRIPYIKTDASVTNTQTPVSNTHSPQTVDSPHTVSRTISRSQPPHLNSDAMARLIHNIIIPLPIVYVNNTNTIDWLSND